VFSIYIHTFVPSKSAQEYQEELNSVQLTICGKFADLPDHTAQREGIEEYILIYCLQGEGYLITEGNYQTAQAGDLIFLKKGMAHTYGSSKDSPWSILWAHCSGNLTQTMELLPELSTNSLIHLGYDVKIEEQFNSIIELSQNQTDILEMLHLNQQFRSLLCHIFLNTQKADHDQIIHQIKEYINSHCTENPSLNDLSKKFSISKYHLVRKFKKATGYTPIEFLNRQKIGQACHLLISTNDSISQISMKTGYATPYYFSLQFKTITGYSPSQFRKLARKEYF
jgi:AraC-like DNA-binding protein